MTSSSRPGVSVAAGVSRSDLEVVLDAESGRLGGPPMRAITDLAPAARQSSADTFVLDCAWEDGTSSRVLWKRGRTDHRDPLRRGVAYEGLVYDRLLRPAGLNVPRFLGRAVDPVPGEAWLFLEFLEDAVPLHQSEQERVLEAAATWLGRLHGRFAAAIGSPEAAFVGRQNGGDVRRWVLRCARLASLTRGGPAWLIDRADRLAERASGLLDAPPTLVHGEFYPANILVQHGRPVPVDWEGAAWAAGEIDLAALTEGWPARDERSAVGAYREARWAGWTPTGFDVRYQAARAYLACRWLGDRPEWMLRDRGLFEQLKDAAERLGVL